MKISLIFCYTLPQDILALLLDLYKYTSVLKQCSFKSMKIVSKISPLKRPIYVICFNTLHQNVMSSGILFCNKLG